MRYTVSQADSVQYSVVGNGPVFYGSRAACDRIARELNDNERSVCGGCFRAFGCACDPTHWYPVVEDCD